LTLKSLSRGPIYRLSMDHRLYDKVRSYKNRVSNSRPNPFKDRRCQSFRLGGRPATTSTARSAPRPGMATSPLGNQREFEYAALSVSYRCLAWYSPGYALWQYSGQGEFAGNSPPEVRQYTWVKVMAFPASSTTHSETPSPSTSPHRPPACCLPPRRHRVQIVCFQPTSQSIGDYWKWSKQQYLQRPVSIDIRSRLERTPLLRQGARRKKPLLIDRRIHPLEAFAPIYTPEPAAAAQACTKMISFSPSPSTSQTV